MAIILKGIYGFFTACYSISSNSPTLLDVPQEMIESVIGQIPSSLNRLIDRSELNQSIEQMLEDETRVCHQKKRN